MTDEAVAEIRRAIGGSKSLLVARAADIAGGRGLQELIPDMSAAFGRFTVNGAQTDKQCNAKIAITAALNRLESIDDSIFLVGSRYVQLEPVYGEDPKDRHIDTAAEVRRNCASGIARIGRPDAHYVLTDMLVDNECTVRVATVRALSYLATPASELLLRLKVLTGDNIEVISECFTSLLVMCPDRSLDFVSRYLKSDDAPIAESAALSIGESRVPGAFEALRKCWDENPSPSSRRALLLPIALVRSDEAFDFLLNVVQTADDTTSAQAVTALDLYADSGSVRKVQEALSRRQKGF